jgi:hypothetical protein
MGEDITRRFEEKECQLKVKTHTPEDLAAQRDYIAKLPMAINELKAEIDQTEVASIQHSLSSCMENNL